MRVTDRARVKEILRVEEHWTIAAMRHVWERMKLVIEPSSAVPIGALLNEKQRFTGKRIGIILSGGNVDLERLPWPAPEDA